MLNGALLTLALTGTMVFGVTDGYAAVRNATMTVKGVYSTAAHIDFSDPKAVDHLTASAQGLHGLANMVESNQVIALR